jgi:DNA-binding MarR family transcriptional regulator/N-acetylglutamate synthase-like GNAT family acetyltransferase
MDALRGYGELGLGSRLKRLSENMMKEIQLVYDYFNIDFDPYLFPIIKIIDHNNGITNSEIKSKLALSQPAITQATNKLMVKGLVSSKSDAKDGRKKIVSLSDKGKRVIGEMQPLWQAMDEVIKGLTRYQAESLIDHINRLEDNLSRELLSTTIINKTKARMNNAVEIINFETKYSKDFYDLNIEWLKTFFYVEPYDEEVLNNPDKYITGKGGHIFFARKKDRILGTVALMPMDEDGVFELTKMAVSPELRGQKIGQRLMRHCIDFAKNSGMRSVILYSNTRLENAIYIYRKYGFIEIPVEEGCPYVRCNIKMEHKLN